MPKLEIKPETDREPFARLLAFAVAAVGAVACGGSRACHARGGCWLPRGLPLVACPDRCGSIFARPLSVLSSQCPIEIVISQEVNKGRYYGSDAVRSPIDVYRGPGDPPYIGD